ncbi:MAG: hypothetical protein V3T31_08040 [candidate division Zixibacteria bacterium]
MPNKITTTINVLAIRIGALTGITSVYKGKRVWLDDTPTQLNAEIDALTEDGAQALVNISSSGPTTIIVQMAVNINLNKNNELESLFDKITGICAAMIDKTGIPGRVLDVSWDYLDADNKTSRQWLVFFGNYNFTAC